jgi:fluoroquinolone resistance protein
LEVKPYYFLYYHKTLYGGYTAKRVDISTSIFPLPAFFAPSSTFSRQGRKEGKRREWSGMTIPLSIVYNTGMSFDLDSYYQEKFARLSFAEAKLESIRFEECEFDGCSLINCKLVKCKFLNCRFKDCVLSAINPQESSYNEVHFSNSKVIGCDWTKTRLVEDLDFTDCQINYSNFKLMKLPGLKLLNCEAKEADFIETDLSRGVFKNTDFENSRFFKTNLTLADFRGARNYNIDVKNNILKKARFSLPEVLSLLNSLDIILD